MTPGVEARRTFKAILGAPKMVAPIPGDQHDQEEDVEDSAAMAQKRNIDPHAEIPAKRSRIS